MRIMSRAAFTMLLGVVIAGPTVSASAQQTSVKQEYEDIKNGLGFGRDRPPIDYTERAPLVVPPNYNLPPPGGPDPERLGVNDPDIAARRRALTDSRRPVPPTDPGAYASGRMQRKYLVDPPSGMRDPAAVAADISHGDAGPAAGTSKGAKHARHRRKAAAQEAAQ